LYVMVFVVFFMEPIKYEFEYTDKNTVMMWVRKLS